MSRATLNRVAFAGPLNPRLRHSGSEAKGRGLGFRVCFYGYRA